MSAQHDQQPQDDSPLAKLHFNVGTRHAQEGIKILDHEGQLVAVVVPLHKHADLIARLFASAPQLFYGVSRARGQLRRLAQRTAHPEDDQTTAVRQLLRELDEQMRK